MSHFCLIFDDTTEKEQEDLMLKNWHPSMFNQLQESSVQWLHQSKHLEKHHLEEVFMNYWETICLHTETEVNPIICEVTVILNGLLA